MFCGVSVTYILHFPNFHLDTTGLDLQMYWEFAGVAKTNES